MNFPLPTKHIELRADGDYSSVVTITGVESKITVASGLSRPKVVRYRNSDGTISTTLIKGGDDLRQDAIMEQVFDQVNEFLKRDERTRSRTLNVEHTALCQLDLELA